MGHYQRTVEEIEWDLSENVGGERYDISGMIQD
jgi:hypothetical protein